MGKEFRNVFLITAGIALLIPLLFGATSAQDYFLGLGFTTLGLGLISILAGLIVAIANRPDTAGRKYGTGLLLTAGILLLASFTLCTGGALGG